MESAILFESGFKDVVDKVITITASPETRIERTMKRDNTTKEQVIARMNRQMQDEKRVRLSDYIISNNTNDNVEQQIKTIIETLSKQVQ
jgi:dephospho-CoA kinase